MTERKIIDVFQINTAQSSLVGDLTLTAPDHLRVTGCESREGRIIRTFNRRRGPPDLLIISNGNPPRGEFDLWDSGTDILIRDQYPHALNLLDVVRYKDNMRTGLVPVRTTEQDLITARKVAASWLFAGDRCAFVLLKTDEPEDHYLNLLASIGPVAPVQLSFRSVQPWAFEHQQVPACKTATAEGQAFWEWLPSFIGLSSK